MAKKRIKIKKVYLNNKSRKGHYYYIKGPNKPARYYKYKEGVSIDNYLLVYQGKLRSKRSGVLQYDKKSPAKLYIEKIETKGKKIDDLMFKGISDHVAGDLIKMDRKKIHTAYELMLRDLVKDKDLLGILAMPENIKKVKHRIQIDLTVSDGKDKEFVLRTYNKTIEQVQSDLQQTIKGRYIHEEQTQELTRKGYTMIKAKGIQIKGSPDVAVMRNIQNIKMRIRFVKGK